MELFKSMMLTPPGGGEAVGAALESGNNSFTGENTFAKIPNLTPVALGATTALAINTYYYGTLSEARTFTFTGTPAEGNVIVIELDISADFDITIPSSILIGGTDTPITSRTMTTDVPYVGVFKYIGSAWRLRDSIGLGVGDLEAGVGQVDPANVAFEGVNLSTGDVRRWLASQFTQPMAPGTFRSNTLETAQVPQDNLISDVLGFAFPTGGSVGHVPVLTDVDARTFELQAQSGGSGTPTLVNLGTDSTFAVDLSDGDFFYGVLSANATVSVTINGAADGKFFRIEFENPSTYTLTWSGVDWEGGSQPTLSTGGAIDTFEVYVRGTNVRGKRAYTDIPEDNTPPTVTAASVDTTGLILSVTFDEPVGVGAGGSGGWALSNLGTAATLSGFALAGDNLSATWDISRAITDTETPELDYTQPGNGIEDLSGNDLATFTGGTITNNSTVPGAPTFLLEDDLEYVDATAAGVGGWTGSGGSWGNTTSPAPLQGTYSLRLGSSSTHNWEHSFTANGTIYGRLRFVVTDISGTPYIFRIGNASTQNSVRFRVLSTGAVRILDSTASTIATSGSGLVSANTEYWLWYELVKGTGSNGEVRVRLGTTSTKPGGTIINSSSGTWADDFTRINLYTAATGHNTIYDEIRVSDADFS
jgi:hypothetical protein